MGKATIVSGGTDGLYSVSIDSGTAQRASLVVKLTAEQAELVINITAWQTAYGIVVAKEDDLKTAATDATDAYVAATVAVGPAKTAVDNASAALAAVQGDPFATPEEKSAAQDALTAANAAYKAAQDAVPAALDAYTAAAKALAEAKKNTAPLRLMLDALKSRQAQLVKDLAKFNALILTETKAAWCADYTEDATGDVATIEIPGEDKIVLIAPAAPAHVSATDGLLTAREVQTPEQVFFNAAILPGWQKFKPTYRRGTITAINTGADTADVTLDTTDKSSAQQLVINQTPTLSSVPVEYMTCNSGAFVVGDKCVVKFTAQDWDQPKIIGFVDNPKRCNWPCVHASPFYYRYIIENVLSDSQPDTMSDLMSTVLSVEVRANRGAWVSMSFIQTIIASGGRNFNQWREPGAPGSPRAELLVGYNFYLSQTNELSAPSVDGVALQPPLPAGVPAGSSIPTIHEYKITVGAEIRFNAAVYSDPGLNVPVTSGQAKARGGIQLNAGSDSMPVTVLDYAFGDPPPP